MIKVSDHPFSHIHSAIAIAIVGFICYFGTFHYPFAFDDVAFFLDGALFETDKAPVRRLTGIGELWSFNAARIIPFASFSLNYIFGGTVTFSYHLVNFAIHMANGVIVYFFVGAILRLTTGDEEKALPLFVALVFIAHPVQTQAVTYIWQRIAMLAALGYMLSLTLYLRSVIARRGNETVRANRLLGLSVTVGALAMFTKQTTITLPIAIALADYCFVSGSIKAFRERAHRWGLFAPLMMITPLLTLFGLNREMSDIGSRAANILPVKDYLFTEFNVVVTYIRLILFPVDQSIDYDYPASAGFADSAFSIVLLALIFALAVVLFKKAKMVSFGILFFFLALGVESSLFPIEDVIFEHRLYLPIAGFALAFATILRSFFYARSGVHGGAIFTIVTMVIVISLMITTVNRNSVWQSRERLWTNAVAKAPLKPRPHIILGNILLGKGSVDDAQKQFTIALKLARRPSEASLAWLGKGKAFEITDDNKKAWESYQQAVKADPASATGYYALARLAGGVGDIKSMAAYLTLSAKARPGSLALRLELGDALWTAGYLDEAISVFELIVALRPDVAIAHQSLEKLYMQTQQRDPKPNSGD